ncbi:His-Xaa-Ser system protein HxsD [Aquipseudomonas alcaligenes]|uniref:His-Xaa-Ser system protein HxsD n=1 Tax=Aquipseudomonas alcaligenes TaxID=43263 RepID=UPI00374A226F
MLWSRKITIDAQVYPLPVAQKTAYALADTLSILIQQTGGELELLVSPAASDAALSENAASALLIRTLNDFALREQVLKETSGIRELLARTALIGASG